MKELTIDAHKWMSALRFEYYRVAQLRELRVGEELWVAYFAGPGAVEGAKGHCEAYFKRVRGGYEFAAVWTINWTGNPRRPHVMTFGKFNLLPGNLIQFASERDLQAEKPFRRVCRYAEFIERHAKDYGIKEPAPYHCHALWRGMTVLKDGYTKYGVEGPIAKGLEAILEMAMALGVVPQYEHWEDCAVTVIT